MDAQTDHFQIKGFIFKSAVGGDDMHVNTHVEPDQNLVVEFGSRAPVETGGAVDIDLFQCGAHEIMELDVEQNSLMDASTLPFKLAMGKIF